MLQRLLILGASGHARVVADAARRSGRFEVIGFIDDVSPERRGEPFCGAAVLGGADALRDARADCVMLGFGDNALRLQRGAELQAAGITLATLAHPSAVIADGVRPGAGSFIGAGAIVNAGARIGMHVIVNSGAIVEHDCDVGNGVHLSPRACLCGGVSVGRGTWIGAGAVVRERLAVGAGSVVGIGAVVTAALPAGVVAYGNPARIVSRAEPT